MKTREISANDSLRPNDELVIVRQTERPVAITVDPATLPILQPYWIENCSPGPVYVHPGRHSIRPGYRVRVYTADRLTMSVVGSRLN
jgi:hypothetical protein